MKLERFTKQNEDQDSGQLRTIEGFKVADKNGVYSIVVSITVTDGTAKDTTYAENALTEFADMIEAQLHPGQEKIKGTEREKNVA